MVSFAEVREFYFFVITHHKRPTVRSLGEVTGYALLSYNRLNKRLQFNKFSERCIAALYKISLTDCFEPLWLGVVLISGWPVVRKGSVAV
jgi:hypothetical protein